MAITSTQTNATENTRVASGSLLDDAGAPVAAALTLGFKPRYIRVENATDRISFEWFEGMTSAHSVKTVAAGTRTLETSACITVSGGAVGFPVIQNKQYRWYAMG